MRLFKPHELQKLDEKQIRREYTRMRKEALRRLAILERENLVNYIDNVPEITQARGQSTPKVYKELRNLNTFLKNPFTRISFVKNFEKQIVETLSESYSNINSSNVRGFNKFMAELKGFMDERVFSSDRVAEVFDQTQRLNMDVSAEEMKKNIDYLQKHIDSIFEMSPQKNNKPMTMRELKRRISIYEKTGTIVGAGS